MAKTGPRSHTAVPPVTEDQLPADPLAAVFSLGKQKGNSSRPIELRSSEGLGSFRRKTSGSPGNGHRSATPKLGFLVSCSAERRLAKPYPWALSPGRKKPPCHQSLVPAPGEWAAGSGPFVASCGNHPGDPVPHPASFAIILRPEARGRLGWPRPQGCTAGFT